MTDKALLKKVALASNAQPVAYRVLRKRHDGEWVTDGRAWCDGVPTQDLVDDIALRSDGWRIEYAFAAPTTQAAPQPPVAAQEPIEVHEPKCPALIGDACTCDRHDPAADKAWARFCAKIGDGPNAPSQGFAHFGGLFSFRRAICLGHSSPPRQPAAHGQRPFIHSPHSGLFHSGDSHGQHASADARGTCTFRTAAPLFQ